MALSMRLVFGLIVAAVTVALRPAIAGAPVVHVDTDEKAKAAHVSASIDIAAPPPVVWAVITD